MRPARDMGCGCHPTLSARKSVARRQESTAQPFPSAIGSDPLRGLRAPSIVMPNAVLNQSNATQSIALKHEQSHIAADDPALLLVGLVLVILAPWNFALWWQLRRLRFAIEVDCDARVLDSGVETVAYGETPCLSASRVGRAFRNGGAYRTPVSTRKESTNHDDRTSSIPKGAHRSLPRDRDLACLCGYRDWCPGGSRLLGNATKAPRLLGCTAGKFCRAH